MAQKFINAGKRIYNYFFTFHTRLARLFFHFIILIKITLKDSSLNIHYSYKVNPYLVWLSECFFYIIDILAIPEILETIIDFIHWRNRKLNKEELEAVISVYRDSLDIRLVQIDEYRIFLPKKVYAFVGFNTIFFNLEINKPLLIHEVCHCFQYQKFGSVYIVRALLAQYSSEGYNYGGKENINKLLSKKQLYKINYEQMADIMADYYNLKNPVNYNEYEDQENIKKSYHKMVNLILQNNLSDNYKFIR